MKLAQCHKIICFFVKASLMDITFYNENLMSFSFKVDMKELENLVSQIEAEEAGIERNLTDFSIEVLYLIIILNWPLT